MRHEGKLRAYYFILSTIIFLIVTGLIFAVISVKSNDKEESSKNENIVIYKLKKDYKEGTDSPKNETPYQIFASIIIEYLNWKKAVEKSKNNKYENVKIIPDNTVGSYNTLTKLDKGGNIGIGIVQSDVLFHYFHGYHNQFPRPKKNAEVRAVARLFEEWFVSYIEESSGDHSDLYIDAKYIGNELLHGSGSLVTSTNVLTLLEKPTVTNPSLDKKLLKLEVIAPPRNTEDHCFVGMHEAEAELIANVFEESYHVINSDSVKKKYGNNVIDSERSFTIGTDAILVVSRQLPNFIVEDLKELIECLHTGNEWCDTFHNRARLAGFDVPKKAEKKDSQSKQKDKSDPKLEARYKKLPISKHYALVNENSKLLRCMAKWFTEKFLNLLALFLSFNFLMYAAFPHFKKNIQDLVINVEALYEFARFKVFRKKIRKRPVGIGATKSALNAGYIISKVIATIFFFTFLISLIHILIAIAIWVSEVHYSKQNLVSNNSIIYFDFIDLIRWIGNFIVFGDRSAIESPLGIIWCGFIKIGHAVGSYLFIYILFKKIDQQYKKFRMRSNNTYIIIGWNGVGSELIKELDSRVQHSEGIKPNITLLNSRQLSEIDYGGKDEVLHHMISDKIKTDLQNIPINKAKSLIILSDDHWSTKIGLQDSDLLTLRILKEINDLSEESDKSNMTLPKVVAQFKDSKNEQLAKSIYTNSETLCVQKFGYQLLAHSAEAQGGMIDVYDELLKTEGDSNEIWELNMKESYFKNSENSEYRTLIQRLQELGELKDKTPIGFFKYAENGSKVVKLNPKPKEIVTQKDSLLYIGKSGTQ